MWVIVHDNHNAGKLENPRTNRCILRTDGFNLNIGVDGDSCQWWGKVVILFLSLLTSPASASGLFRLGFPREKTELVSFSCSLPPSTCEPSQFWRNNQGNFSKFLIEKLIRTSPISHPQSLLYFTREPFSTEHILDEGFFTERMKRKWHFHSLMFPPDPQSLWEWCYYVSIIVA